jgi:hypothetical protein
MNCSDYYAARAGEGTYTHPLHVAVYLHVVAAGAAEDGAWGIEWEVDHSLDPFHDVS